MGENGVKEGWIAIGLLERAKEGNNLYTRSLGKTNSCSSTYLLR